MCVCVCVCVCVYGCAGQVVETLASFKSCFRNQHSAKHDGLPRFSFFSPIDSIEDLSVGVFCKLFVLYYFLLVDPQSVGTQWLNESYVHSDSACLHTVLPRGLTCKSVQHTITFMQTLSSNLSIWNTHTHTHGRTHARTHARTHTRTHTNTHTNTHTHTQTHTQTHNPIHSSTH